MNEGDGARVNSMEGKRERKVNDERNVECLCKISDFRISKQN